MGVMSEEGVWRRGGVGVCVARGGMGGGGKEMSISRPIRWSADVLMFSGAVRRLWEGRQEEGGSLARHGEECGRRGRL